MLLKEVNEEIGSFQISLKPKHKMRNSKQDVLLTMRSTLVRAENVVTGKESPLKNVGFWWYSLRSNLFPFL